MIFQDIQNTVLTFLRLDGIDWGGPNGSTIAPPYEVNLFINSAYQEFLARTMDKPIAALKIPFPTVATTNAYQLNPIPASGATINPSALHVYELTYTQAGAQEMRIPYYSTARFRALTAQYVARYGNYSNYPYGWTQLFNKRQIDIYPGTANSTDSMAITICPDPMSSPASVSAAQGGLLVAASDVPLFYPQFHIALAHHAAATICLTLSKNGQYTAHMQRFNDYVDNALAQYVSSGEGDAEQYVQDGIDIPRWG